MIFPTVAVVAALDPLTAAKRAEPITLVWSRRPGRKCTMGDSPLNRRSDISVLNMISPIHTNIGMQDNSQEVAFRIINGAMLVPILIRGQSSKKYKPEKLTNNKPANTQTPKPRYRIKKSKIINAVASDSIYLS